MLSFKEYLNEVRGALVEALDEAKTWYDTKTGKFIKVLKSEENHHWAPILNPKKYRLKKIDVAKFEKAMERNRDEIPGISKLMLDAGWVRVSTSLRRSSWNLQSKTLDQAAAAARALNKKFVAEVIFLDYGKKSATLVDNQVKTFIRTGEIVPRSRLSQFRDHVELDEKIRDLDKWWYDTKKRKAISIATDFHGQAVVRDPKKYGLTMSFLVSRRGLGLTQRELRSETIGALDDHLFRKGWVQVTWARNIEELTLRGESNSEIQKTAKWFLNKINPTPAQTVIDSDTHGFDRIVGDGIDVFAKTGKVVKRTDIGSTMARFR